jgi:hypothetical protein
VKVFYFPLDLSGFSVKYPSSITGPPSSPKSVPFPVPDLGRGPVKRSKQSGTDQVHWHRHLGCSANCFVRQWFHQSRPESSAKRPWHGSRERWIRAPRTELRAIAQRNRCGSQVWFVSYSRFYRRETQASTSATTRKPNWSRVHTCPSGFNLEFVRKRMHKFHGEVDANATNFSCITEVQHAGEIAPCSLITSLRWPIVHTGSLDPAQSAATDAG